MLKRAAAALALLLVLAGASAPSVKYSANYVVTVIPFGDSITYGVGDAVEAGWRSDWYAAALARGKPVFFIGTISFGGTDNDLAIDPWNEGNSGDTCVALNSVMFRGQVPGPPSGPLRSPDVWTIACGTNDLDPAIGNFTVNQTESHLTTILNTACANLDPQKPWALIALFEIYPRQDAPVEANVEIVNAWMPTGIAGSNCPSKITLIHTNKWNGSYVVDPTNPSFYFNTQHFNRAGYALEGAAIDAQMAPVIAAARP